MTQAEPEHEEVRAVARPGERAPVVEVVRVSKRFGALTVIEDLSFALADGEALGIVGPNGAGKTTTLDMVAGDLAPSSGTIRLNGRDVTGLRSHRRCRLGIGRTAQVPRPFERMTVFENVLVGASHGRTSSKHAVDVSAEALRTAGMLGRANVRAGELTLLDRKRLELARALATEPTVLLLDEIAGGLTEGEVLQLVETVHRIHASGMSIIWIEHIVHALLRVVDRMLALDYGRMLIEGDPREVMASDAVRDVYLGAE